MKNDKMKWLSQFTCTILLVFLFLACLCSFHVEAYADEEDDTYQLMDTRLTYEGAEINHSEQVTDGRTYVIQYPFGTEEIYLYNDQSDTIYGRDDNGRMIELSREDCSYKDGWWKIDFSTGYYDGKKHGVKNTYKSRTGKTYDAYASYYFVSFVRGADLFIQVGDANDPLDVLVKWNANNEYNKPTQLVLITGKNGRALETSQPIYYTMSTDGTEPTDPDGKTSSQKFKTGRGPTITKNTIIKARTNTGTTKNPILGKVCTLNVYVRPEKPVISPYGGDYVDPVSVELVPPSNNSTVYYTTDGTDPTDESTQYTGTPITIESDTTLKAIAYEGEMSPSEIVEERYRFSNGLSLKMAEGEKATWHGNLADESSHKAFLITPYNKDSCNLIATVPDGAELLLDGQKLSAKENGEYSVSLKAVKVEGLGDVQLEEAKAGNVFTVRNRDVSVDYSVYCIEAICDGLPDEITDYFCVGSQYTNGSFGAAIGVTLAGFTSTMECASIGNFGGYAVWHYVDGIENDPKNPYGVDFIVYGNSFDGTTEAAEPGNILVSENGTDWYSLAGSLHYDNNATWNQQITYSRSSRSPKKTDLSMGDEVQTINYVFPLKSAYPWHSAEEDFTSFTTTGTLLQREPGLKNTMPPYPAFGYADTGLCIDNNNQAQNPYGGLTINDPEIEYGGRIMTNRTGDACDISWAVDSEGRPVSLKKVHYIKVQTATCIDDDIIGEKSTEVCCMRIAKAAESAVGVTDAPKSIKIDGQEVALKADEVVDVNVSGIFDIVVDAPEDANVYINSLRSHTAFMDKAPHSIVRVIVQEGKKEPQIYYYKITQDPQPESKKVTTITFKTRTGANSNLNGLLHDKDSLTCYFDEDTVEHFGGEVRFSEATSAKESKGFVCWKDSEGKVYSAFNAAMTESGTDLALTATYADKDDAEKVKAAVALIADLPSSDKVTLEDNEAILKAKKAYDELTDEQKGFVAESYSNKLTADQNAIIKIVEDKIDALPEADAVKTTDAEAVIAAGAAFDSLADTQKALVDQAKAEKLAAVRLALFDAFAAAIPDEVTEEQEDALTAAQAVYDSLSNDLKVQAAANYIKLVEAKLSVAMEKLEKANQQIADKQSEIDKLTNETIPALTQQLNDKIAELKTAKEEEIPALQAEIAELEQKLEKAGSDLADANAEIEELRKELVDNSIKDLIESAEKTIAAIQKDLKEAGDSISTKAIKALVETADQILDAAKTKAEEASAALAENAKEIASLRDQVAKASADLAKAGEELAKAVASGKASEAEITGLKDRLAEAEAAKAEAEKAAQEALAGKQTSDEALEAAQKALKETQDELEKTAAELAALQAKIAASKFKVTGLTVTSKSSKFTVTWTKFDGADGYKVQYRKKGAKKFKNLKVLTKNKVVSKKLKKGKAYQFRVRTYKMVGEKKVYGKWAKSKAVKCK